MTSGWHKGMPDDIERIYISMKTPDLVALDEKVAWLKANGWPAMNRSRLLRIALGALDVERMVGPLLDQQPPPAIEEPIVVEKPRASKRKARATRMVVTVAEVAVWHCGYCGEAGHNIRTCPSAPVRPSRKASRSTIHR